MKKLTKILALLLVLAMAAGMAACGNTATEEPPAEKTPTGAPTAEPLADEKFGGVLKIGSIDAILDITPWQTLGYFTCLASNFMFESLMSNTGEPVLLDELVADAENMTYTLKVKQGIKFHDGTDLNAEAVIWNINNYSAHGASAATAFSSVESLEAVDEYTVVMHLSTWDALMASTLATSAGYMASPTFYSGHEDDAAWLAANACGTGPFKLVKWNQGQILEVERFDDYWQGKPYLDGMQWFIYSDNLTLEAAIRGGDIDLWYMFDLTLYDSFIDIPDYTIDAPYIPELGGLISFICFDCVNENDPLSNPLVRKAICYAIDKDTMNVALRHGLGVPTNQLAKPGSGEYNTEVEEYSYNPEKAKELLAEAGYADGCTIKLSYNATESDNTVVIQDMLAKVGITVDMNPTDSAAVGTMMYDWGEGMYYHGGGLSANMGTQFKNMFRREQENRVGYGDFIISDELDALSAAIPQATDLNDELRMCREVNKIVCYDDVLLCPLFCETFFDIRVSNLAMDGISDWTYWPDHVNVMYFG